MKPFVLTIQLMIMSVLIAGSLGLVGAWAVSTARNGGRIGRWISRCFFVAVLASLALPLILHAAAWEATAGKFGWLPLTQIGSRLADSRANGSLYGGIGGVFGGLIASGWIHGIYGAALVALATWHGVSRVPSAVVQQARLDLGPLGAWWRVVFPIALPWFTTALLATAALATTEMTVVNLYGYRTIADTFYLQHAINPALSSMSSFESLWSMAWTCLMPAVFAGLILFVVGSGIGTRINLQETDASSVVRDEHPVLQGVASIVAVCIASLISVVPISGLLVKLGHEIVFEGGQRSASWSIDRCIENVASAPTTFTAEYGWTAVLATLTGITAMTIGWLLSAWARRSRFAKRCFDYCSILMLLIPGPIVGLLVIRFFQIPVPGFRSLYQQSLLPTVLALLVRALPVAYWIIRSGYRGLGDQVLDVANLEMGIVRRLWTIDRPLLKRSLFAAALAAGIVASGDVPATLPVLPPVFSTVGTRLFEQLHSGARYQEASLAIWYVAAVIVIATLWARRNENRVLE